MTDLFAAALARLAEGSPRPVVFPWQWWSLDAIDWALIRTGLAGPCLLRAAQHALRGAAVIFGLRKGGWRMTTQAATPPRRNDKSHVNDDGRPKAVFETREAADREAERLHLADGRRLFPYECWMRPQHWHFSKREPDLR